MPNSIKIKRGWNFRFWIFNLIRWSPIVLRIGELWMN